MRVQIDKAGRDDTTGGVENTVGGLALEPANLGDFAVLDRNVADVAGCARPINNRAALNDDVVIRHSYLLNEPAVLGFWAHLGMFRLGVMRRNEIQSLAARR